MEAEFTEFAEKVRLLIQRVRELETRCEKLAAENDDLHDLRKAAADRLTGILNRLDEPE